jgi:hypothetical protein
MAGYVPAEAPPRGGTEDRSRFATGTSPAGQKVTIPQGINLALQALLDERIAEVESLEPPPKEIVLRRIARTVDGEYVLVPCRPITVRPDSKPATTGRFSKRRRRAGAGVDEILLGRDWSRLHNDDVDQAFRELAAQERFEWGRELRKLNEILMLIQLARSGVTRLRAWDLPL